jgi:hypothetical protein
MPKFLYFNDTQKVVHIHPATESHGTTCDMSPIQPLTIREFELPEGTYPWFKQWKDGTILVSPTRDDASANNEPKHLGKHPIDFSFTDISTGENIVEFCNKMLETPDLRANMYSMLIIIRNQAQRHLDNEVKKDVEKD